MKIKLCSLSGASSKELEAFFDGYIAAALWSSNDSEGNPLDSNYDDGDFDRSTLNALKRECVKFLRESENLIRQFNDSIKGFSNAGHDFWLTRNGHGSGFWDGDWGNVGDALTKNCKRYKQLDLYVGDNGKIYV